MGRYQTFESVFVVFNADVGSCAVHGDYCDNYDVLWICCLYTQCLCSDWSIVLERNVIGRYFFRNESPVFYFYSTVLFYDMFQLVLRFSLRSYDMFRLVHYLRPIL